MSEPLTKQDDDPMLLAYLIAKEIKDKKYGDDVDLMGIVIQRGLLVARASELRAATARLKQST